MNRRSLLSRALACLGLGAVSVVAHEWPPILRAIDFKPEQKNYPWEVLRWQRIDHVDGYGVSLLMEIAMEGRKSRLVVRDCRHGEGWSTRDYAQPLAQMKAMLLRHLQELNDAEIMALYA